MALPESVIWSQGLFLYPQHLQQTDRYQSARLDLCVSAAGPFPWGVLDLRVDEPALLRGSFKVNQITCVFAHNGVVLRYEDGEKEPDGLVAARPLDDHFPSGVRSLDVFVGVPREDPQRRQGTSKDGSDSPQRLVKRKVVDTISPDISDVDREREVELAVPNAGVYFGGEIQKFNVAGIKVAELVRGKGSQIELRREFIPSCRRIGVSKALIDDLNGLRSRAVDERDLLLDGVGSHDVEGMFRVNALEQMVLVLNHMLHARDWLPPEALYIELVRMIGSFGIVGRKGRKNIAPPPFNYLDLGSCLFAACQLLASMLGGGEQKFLQVPLVLESGGKYLVGQIDDPRAFRGTLYLAVLGGPNAKLVLRNVKIAEEAQIKELMMGAYNGVPLVEAVPSPPQLPSGRTYLKFDLNTDRGRQYWPGVVGSQTLALYLPPNAAPRGIRPEWYALYSVLP
jgi:type VI secretion system protein ImpJ